MSDTIEKLIKGYTAACFAANGTRPTITYKSGWFSVTIRGLEHKHRRADLIRFTDNLRARGGQE